MSLDLSQFVTSMLDQASRWFGALLPTIGVVVGLTIAVVLVIVTVKAIRKVVPHD